jgi:type II secretory pathway component PulM
MTVGQEILLVVAIVAAILASVNALTVWFERSTGVDLLAWLKELNAAVSMPRGRDV